LGLEISYGETVAGLEPSQAEYHLSRVADGQISSVSQLRREVFGPRQRTYPEPNPAPAPDPTPSSSPVPPDDTFTIFALLSPDDQAIELARFAMRHQPSRQQGISFLERFANRLLMCVRYPPLH
jgi:hypothetical protein